MVVLNVNAARVRGVMDLIKLFEHLASQDFRRNKPARMIFNKHYLARYGKCYAKAESTRTKYNRGM